MIELLGTKVLSASESTWAFLDLSGRAIYAGLWRFFTFRFRYRETVDQLYSIGVQSLPVMVFSLCFTGLIITLEFSFHMKLVLRQDSLVPGFSTVLMIREIGPVVTSLLLVSRVGAAIATELATMKVTDQIDALKLLAIDPIEFLTLPRWVGCVFATASISIIAIAVAILSGVFVSSYKLGIPMAQYVNTMFSFSSFSDFGGCLLKSLIFGTIIPLIASHHGFRARYGAQGVGNAATSAVVNGTMLIIIADFFITYGLYQP